MVINRDRHIYQCDTCFEFINKTRLFCIDDNMVTCHMCHKEQLKEQGRLNKLKKEEEKKYTISDEYLQLIKEGKVTKIQRSGLDKYKLTIEQFNKMYVDQKGCCKICGISEIDAEGVLHIDHCHITGKVRGLLCRMCNMMLGFGKDNIEIMESAIKYLKSN